MILGDFIRRNAHLYPHKTAFVGGERRVTFSEFQSRVNRLVDGLDRLGVGPGERVGVLARNSIEFMEVLGSAEKGGRIAVPLNWRLSLDELLFLLNDAECSALVAGPGYLEIARELCERAPALRHLIAVEGPGDGVLGYEALLASSSDTEPDVDISPDDVAYLIYTSGTTGLPRAAMLTHGGQVEDARVLLAEMRIGPHDIHLAIMPFFHVGGRNIPLTHFYRGCTTVISDGFDAHGMLETIQRERVTTVQVVPTMLAFLLDLPDFASHDLSSLRMVLYASSPMPVELLRRGMSAFGPIFCQAYGQTESGPEVTFLPMEDHLPDGTPAQVRRLASCGLPALNVEVRVEDAGGSEVAPGEVGEIVVRSAHLMQGYWRNPALTAEVLRDGWLHTGDLATTDEDGYIYIVDRKKDMIISGGENIYPREIEEVLYQHPAVLEAAVIGVPDPLWGEAVKAVIVARTGADLTEAEIVQHCKERLASYKKPRSIDLVESLPKSAAGKILKRALRERYWASQQRQV